MLGYYKSSFPKKDGKGKGYYALTQFEPCKTPVFPFSSQGLATH